MLQRDTTNGGKTHVSNGNKAQPSSARTSPTPDTDAVDSSADQAATSPGFATALDQEPVSVLGKTQPSDPTSGEAAGALALTASANDAFQEELGTTSDGHSSEDAALTRSLVGGSLPTDADVGHSDEAFADPLIGMVIAERYRIVEQIGRGGMGIVYRVEHTRIGKLLAMKLLTGELSMNKEIVRRFKQEALTVSKLSNPHTVQVFDYGVWNHLTYLVMELVDGHDLAMPLRREGPMPFARLGGLIVHVCASLAEAHEKGIVHRDIKPENIMVIADARGAEMAKVLDFGLAKLRENPDLNEVTLQGAVVGTPYFMSPEQVTGDEVDGRTDIYSLGAVMFRALTGTYAFQAHSPMAMFAKHLSEPPPSAIERKPNLDIPRNVSDAVQRCMAKAPAERFQTIEALRDVLIAEMQELGLETSDQLYFSSGTRQRLKPRTQAKKRNKTTDQANTKLATRAELEGYERKLRRNRYSALAILAILLLAGVAGGVYFFSLRQDAFLSEEQEPNNAASQAHHLPLGRSVRGYLGQRPEADIGDRDFYAFTVPPSDAPVVSLHVSALPNLPLCALLYRAGYQDPAAQYCNGRPSTDIAVSHLRLEAGDYFIALMQDMRPLANGRTPYVVENVSDTYSISVDLSRPDAVSEIEPNDQESSAARLSADDTFVGALGWVGDEDVVCSAGEGDYEWEVDDAKRPAGTVLEILPSVAGSAAALVRLHAKEAQPFGRPRFEADVNGPWRSPRWSGVSCLRLRLTSDPWSEQAGEPQPDGSKYMITLHAAAAP